MKSVHADRDHPVPALQADAVSHVVEELDRRDDPALKKLFYI